MIKCKDFGFKDCDSEEMNKGDAPVDQPNYPKPLVKFHLVYQSFNQSIEEVYFWLLGQLRDDFGLYRIEKITDIFTASEQSAFWGQAQNRLSIQQGQVSNYMATIGKLTKELFQLVRELRILEERLDLYEETYNFIKKKDDVRQRKKSQAAEVVLRSYWVDLKDGGVKSPGSVYGLASTLGYTALPDLFFAAPPMNRDEVDRYVDRLDFNNKLKDVLRRKLKGYCVWKDFTHRELNNRKGFMVKFLRQHYNAIQMYIKWIKPYLFNVKRLQQNMQASQSEQLIGAFEGSLTEIELILWNEMKGQYVHPAIVLSIEFRTQPHMDFHQDGYQHKGPIHVGRTEFRLRGYVWSEKDIKNYKEMREAETMDLLGDIDKDMQKSLDALGDDLRRYLKEKGEKFPEDIKKEEDAKKAEKKALEEMKNVAEPFKAVFSGFKEIFEALSPYKKKEKPKEGEIPKPDDWKLKKEKKKAEGFMKAAIWTGYKNFKKAHRMVTW
ncbi:hypothetical protein KY362_02750 [Candidatus Woesearchaeota archaeon]|nr:hypothetical protein [Candidatus Woesearchaeota archaeon]